MVVRKVGVESQSLAGMYSQPQSSGKLLERFEAGPDGVGVSGSLFWMVLMQAFPELRRVFETLDRQSQIGHSG